MNGLAIIIVMIISLWSLTKTIEKATNKIVAKQEEQNDLIKKMTVELEKTTSE